MKESEKRRAARIVENLDAEITSGGKTYKGIIMNFSEETNGGQVFHFDLLHLRSK